MTPKELLMDAKAVLLKDGWCQGRFTNHLGEHCTLGSIFLLTEEEEGALEYELDACDAIATAAGVSGTSAVVSWNDQAGRTVEDVLAVFDKAIEAAE